MARFKKKLESINRQWAIQEPDQNHVAQLASTLSVSKVVSQVLLNRKCVDEHTAKKFLNPRLSDLLAPEKLTGVPLAVELIIKAVSDNKKITVYGDYDVDGITSTSILWRLLTMLKADVDFYIPHRVEEGYGLNSDSIRELAENGTQLMITVDCGITAIEETKLAGELGMEVIITDHHCPGEELPKAAAIVHPMLEDYPHPGSCGAMVAFKLAWGICNAYKNKGGQIRSELKQFLLHATDFATLGTIADVMELVGENRSLTKYGLYSISQSELPGMKALIKTAGLDGKDIDSIHIAFQIAPMLNAAGRMGHSRLAVELLTSDNELRSLRIAEYLKQQNNERRKVEQQILKEATSLITASGMDHPDRRSLVLAAESWHIGVVGIVASRLLDKFYRPTILFHTQDDVAKGSARSIDGFNILEAIDACSEHLIGYGGHAKAAGLSIKTEKIPEFTEAFEQYAKENIRDEHFEQSLDIDGLFTLGDFDDRTIFQLEKLGPFGNGNPRPVFASRGVRLIGRPRVIGASGDHLQFAVKDRSGSMACVGFGMANLEKKLLETDYFSIAYEPQMNEFRNVKTPQFIIKDIKFD
ncbi:MAG: single-stranded-DNA-specific exonuclease RecJ [Sedimentisphaeraceae bacterium JB056]